MRIRDYYGLDIDTAHILKTEIKEYLLDNYRIPYFPFEKERDDYHHKLAYRLLDFYCINSKGIGFAGEISKYFNFPSFHGCSRYLDPVKSLLWQQFKDSIRYWHNYLAVCANEDNISQMLIFEKVFMRCAKTFFESLEYFKIIPCIPGNVFNVLYHNEPYKP